MEKSISLVSVISSHVWFYDSLMLEQNKLLNILEGEFHQDKLLHKSQRAQKLPRPKHFDCSSADNCDVCSKHS